VHMSEGFDFLGFHIHSTFAFLPCAVSWVPR
jgi:hypothetical protein